MYLNVNSDPCEGFVRLRWNTYKEWTQTAVGKYEVFANITPPGGPTQYRVLVFQGSASDSAYRHTNVQKGYEYCYYVQATDTTGLYTSTSNSSCISSLVVQGSRLLYLGHATVKTDESIEIYAFIDGEADVIDYGIERADDSIGPYIVLGRIPKPTTGPWAIKFTDYSAQSGSNRYFYRVSSKDSCGAVDTISNLGRNLLLQIRANGNLTNTLAWNPYEDWGGIVESYEVYREVDNNGQWVLAATLGTNDTSYVDDISPFKDGKGAFCYYVKAIEGNNPLGFVNEFGFPFNSVSNTACVTHDARVFIPSAFNPGSDYLENTIWKPTNVFARENSYTLFVMNRWGEKVFQTTSVDEGWDGTFQGSDQPVGVYTYSINYRSLEGLPIEERGSFTLVR
jgi:gliding motility-associated-like protein